MLSYWEREHFVKYDLIVIGAGIVGLSTAIQFKRKFPEKSVLILERGVFPSGASTKNAGFACFGSLTEILDDLGAMSESEVLQLVERRYLGLQAIRKEFGDNALCFTHSKGHELITTEQLPVLDHLDQINGLLQPVFKQDVFCLIRDVRPFGFGTKVKAIVQNGLEGELDTGAFIDTLWTTCLSLQIKILTGAAVEKIDLDVKQVSVKNSSDSSPIEFFAARIAVCTNAFTAKLLPELGITPGRGLVMVTETIPGGIPWEGSFHYDKGYVYFRQVSGRLLLGGGRNLDFEGERTTDFGINPKIRSYLLGLVEELIFPGRKIQIAMEWSGIMAFGQNKNPLVQALGPGIGIAVRMGGMGVALGWQIASELLIKIEQG
jgi:gamma-glutamylputrescine oxidase